MQLPAHWPVEAAEILQCALAEAAVVQPYWRLSLPAAHVELFPGRTPALATTFSLVDI